jgi:uncharacterized protein YlxP (DUF503 family)
MPKICRGVIIQQTKNKQCIGLAMIHIEKCVVNWVKLNLATIQQQTHHTQAVKKHAIQYFDIFSHPTGTQDIPT